MREYEIATGEIVVTDGPTPFVTSHHSISIFGTQNGDKELHSFSEG